MLFCTSCQQLTENNRLLHVFYELTPIIAFNSVMVTCLARSTAAATCCWCSCDKNGMTWAHIAFNLLAISVWKKKQCRNNAKLNRNRLNYKMEDMLLKTEVYNDCPQRQFVSFGTLCICLFLFHFIIFGGWVGNWCFLIKLMILMTIIWRNQVLY